MLFQSSAVFDSDKCVLSR